MFLILLVLCNMRAVITGASRGIGKAIAFKFAKEGFDLAICARIETNLLALQKELNEQYPSVEIIAQVTDVSVKSQIDSFAKSITDKWDKIDVLINNAGTFIKGHIHKEEDSLFEKLMHTNLFSAYYMSKRFLKGMISHKKGHVINIGSTASKQTYLGSGSYSISKFGLLGLTRALRDEMKQYNIRVTIIMPGAVLTDSWEGTKLPPERFMKVEDIADVVWSCHAISDQTNVEEIVLRPIKGDLD